MATYDQIALCNIQNYRCARKLNLQMVEQNETVQIDSLENISVEIKAEENKKEEYNYVENTEQTQNVQTMESSEVDQKPKKKRGRPRKKSLESGEQVNALPQETQADQQTSST